MTNTTTYNVPAASTGMGIRIPTSLIGQYGDTLKEDGQEAVMFATGGVFTATPAANGTNVDLFAVGETSTGTATITDEGEYDSIVLTVTAEAPGSLDVDAAAMSVCTSATG